MDIILLEKQQYTFNLNMSGHIVIDDVSSHWSHHPFLHMTVLVVTQREVRVVGPGEGASTRCCSGTLAGPVVEETQTEAQ